MSRPVDELEVARQRRQETSDSLLASEAEKKLVVAGPGTGKTHNFRRVLEKAQGGLALTFIRALAQDLERDLGDVAQVNTFHGFCKHVAHKLGGVDGLTKSFDYYPELMTLVAEDLDLIGRASVSKEDLERAFRLMDDEGGLLAASIEVGDYYDATSHNDVVYRVERYLEGNPEHIPEYPVVVVDEYQDFNLLETRFIDVLSRRSPVIIAGDDDQALYSFKDASADFIRELSERDGIARFDLPYCSRCTAVVVDAVNELVQQAQRRGKLAGRVEREYLCYLPDKLEDSEAHPALIHAACSVNNKRSPYISCYIEEQISQISVKDIEASREGKHLTALIIGRLHWVEPIYNHLQERFPNVHFQRAPKVSIAALDGYRRLVRDESSRLGWRILLRVQPCDECPAIIREALDQSQEIVDLLPEDYRAHHLKLVGLFKRLLAGEDIEPNEVSELTQRLGMELETILAELQIETGDEEREGKGDEGRCEEEAVPDPSTPSILCTSLVGAKGLSAEHVFIVSFVDGEFPHDPDNVSDTEICELIVGLSRTRKACHLVSCGIWGGGWCKPSIFLRWLKGVPIHRVSVDKKYWN